MPRRWLLGCVGVLTLVASPLAASGADRRLAAAGAVSPSAPLPAMASPVVSPDGPRSPGHAPPAPPAGIPTASPPDAIEPVEPRAEPAPQADPMAAEVLEDLDAEFRYLAVLSGDCDQLVVADRAVPECAGKLVNVDFGNGRVAFLFTGRQGTTDVVTTFSGGHSAQPAERTYRLTIDRMSTTTVGAGGLPVSVVTAVAGECTMSGDPAREAARFECRVRHAGQDTTARFHSTGAPQVYAGGRDRGEADQPADLAGDLTSLGGHDPFARTITH